MSPSQPSRRRWRGEGGEEREGRRREKEGEEREGRMRRGKEEEREEEEREGSLHLPVIIRLLQENLG